MSTNNHLVLPNATSACVKALEERQERILARLQQLQMQIDKLYEDKESTKTVLQTSCRVDAASKCSSSAELISDVAINACPASPPLSVFILYQMLAQQQRVLLHCFIHSTVRNVPVPKLDDAFSCLLAPVANRNHFQLGLSVIWKDVKRGPSLVVSPNKQTPVIGEANIARYLARQLAWSFEADPVVATQIDSVLDYAALLLHSRDPSGAVKSLGSLIGRKKWFVGTDQPSLADIVMWSAIKQRRLAQIAPDNVCQWLARCDALPEFGRAERLLMH